MHTLLFSHFFLSLSVDRMDSKFGSREIDGYPKRHTEKLYGWRFVFGLPDMDTFAANIPRHEQ